jgi:pimeloyl-ACP methyl ester carboxylesterase
VLGASAGGIWSLAYVATHPEPVSHLIVLHAPGRTDFFSYKAEQMARRAGVADEHAIDIYRRFVGGELHEPVEQWADVLARTIVQTQNVNYADPEKHPELIERRERAWKSMATDVLRAELDASRWYLRDFHHNFRVADIGHRIDSPTLVITGAADPVAPPSQAEEIHRAIASSELWIHDGGHMPHGDEQGPFFDRIARFLTEHGIDTPSSAGG